MGYTFDNDECRMCGKKTKSILNINMKAVAICDDCCKTIMLQTAHWLVDNFPEHRFCEQGRK